MSTRPMILAVACALAAGPLAAQGQINLRLAQGQPAKFVPALCPVKSNSSKVDKGISLLRKGYDAKAPAERSAHLAEARVNLMEAITQETQNDYSAAWYYLGRVALLRGDPVETDSAFTKAEALVPLCELDITQYRQNSWAMLANAGIEFQRKSETDSALALFRDASTLFRGLPHVYSNMGVVFANANREDSAAVYFNKALAIAEKDTSLTEDRNSSALNLAIMYSRQKQHLEAVGILRRYLGWKPDDTDARRVLASSFRDAGMPDSADAIEAAMVAGFAKANLDSLDLQDLIAVGVAAYNGKRFAEGEAAFLAVVKRNPWNREARYNLVSSYFALSEVSKDSANALRKLKATADAAKMDSVTAGHYRHLIAAAEALLEIDPMSIDGMRLLARGHTGLTHEDEAIKVITKAVALPFTIEVSGFQPLSNKAVLIADAIGRSPQDVAGKPIKTAPIALVVEFLDLKGTVVDTKEITVPVLTEAGKHPIKLEAAGAGIVGWRYRAK